LSQFPIEVLILPFDRASIRPDRDHGG